MTFHSLPQSSFSRTTATRVGVHHTLLPPFRGKSVEHRGPPLIRECGNFSGVAKKEADL